MLIKDLFVFLEVKIYGNLIKISRNIVLVLIKIIVIPLKKKEQYQRILPSIRRLLRKLISLKITIIKNN
jgi:hypothetical protein